MLLGSLIDLVGRTFGRLQVIARDDSPAGTSTRPQWRCRCSCGNETIVRGAYLLAGRTQSCSCLRAELARGSPARSIPERAVAAGDPLRSDAGQQIRDSRAGLRAQAVIPSAA